MRVIEYWISVKRANLFTLIPRLLTMILLAAVVSCNQSNNLVKPPISEQPPDAGKDTIKLGDTLVLHPKIDNNENGYYNWTLNGISVSADSVYSFVPAAMGDYQINLKASNAGGQTMLSYQIHVWGRYENGYFMLNQGIPGQGAGTLGFYRYNTQTVEDSVFNKENPGKDLGPLSSSLAFGTIYNNQIYLLSKMGGPLVVADPVSLKETGRIPAGSGNDFRSFIGIDNSHGLISTTDGILPLNLQSLTLGSKISGIDGETGDLLKAGNYIFVLSRSQGVLVLDAGSMAILDTIAGIDLAFAQSKDGAIWAAGGDTLFRIDPVTLDTTHIALPFMVNGSWSSWHPGSILASPNGNALFIANNNLNGGGTDVYKYSIGDSGSIKTPFVSIPSGKELSGKGLGYNPKTNQLMLMTVQPGLGTNNSTTGIYSFDPFNASVQNNFSYSGPYNPEMFIFH